MKGGLMKKIVFLLLGIVAVLVIAGGLFFNTQNESQISEPQETKTERESGIDKAMPEDYQNMAEKSKRGIVEAITYETDFENKNYEKRALVYLPVGYQDSREKYDVLYLIHGWSMRQEDFLQGSSVDEIPLWQRMLDHLIADEKIAPMIVVAPTYYPDREMITNNWNDDDSLNERFADSEILELMPLVAEKYRTYAKSGDLNDIKAARDHQAFGGFSMGGITTWYAFQHNLAYFRYFIPMAGPNYGTAETMTAAITENGFTGDDFLICASVGERDGTKSSMAQSIAELREEPDFNEYNLVYFEAYGGHDEESFVAQSFLTLQTFFRKE
ncbi:alpha/beta hydrolase-fold protein [Enterococcus faecium]|uniref:alpha/beta hydrolase-fold protein n=1 Tax=Enterococcus faecium TaxID=1352 RepID=UPI000A342775|nr:alpha/beta hydrolase-fold protein [Enterococcus faecium]OTO53223.1 hypothetical protein A5814_001314 [Enterococcus faecium]